MPGWKLTAVLAITLVTANSVAAQTYQLSEDNLVGQYFRVELNMKLSGEMKLRQGEKTLTYKQAADAKHAFLERILEMKQGVAAKSARVYQTAHAAISSGDAKSERRFRPDRTFLVCQRVDEQPFAFCPKGALNREEVELTEHFDVLSLPGLLPGKKVKIGESWEVSNLAVQSLCYLDGLTNHDLKCTLEAVKGDVADVAVVGTINGIDVGAAAKITVKARYQYDLKVGRITDLTWTQNDERQQGPASPELKLELTTTLKRLAIEPVNELNDFALVPVPTTAKLPEALTRIEYQDPERRFDLAYARAWQVVARTDKHLVMRLLDRGDFVAQVTVSSWQKAEAGKHLSAEEFKKVLGDTPGWEEDETLEAGEIAANNGNWVYRIAATGDLNDVKVVQYVYLVAGPLGDQIIATFTLAPSQTQKLASQDLELIRNIAFPRSVNAQLTSSPSP